jgi:hypothetical protein
VLLDRPRTTRLSSAGGQASIELVALLPVLILVGAALAQGALAGWAVWTAGGAARAAARAHAIGAEPLPAARRAMPRALREGITLRTSGDEVRVAVRVPLLVAGGALTSVTARARLTPQEGT